MKVKRVNCFTATCDRCINRVFVRKNFWGNKLYICNFLPCNHKAISADDCGHFRCDEDSNSILCEDCNKGYTLRRKLR